eukprot:TRINITY_DN1005_c0_g1_i3.p1 TRINITY_DN1005_c0_g1~~TRINITY_DN1005_c0_g1_i3.p1  ORF type:complete len:1292 (-),score=252.58 TRINITY_DN1005_c0_g1_i3:115-3990(-)
MQRDYGIYTPPEGPDLPPLKIHVGVTGGPGEVWVLGEPEQELYMVLHSPALAALGTLLDHAGHGETGISPEAYAVVKEHYHAVPPPQHPGVDMLLLQGLVAEDKAIARNADGENTARDQLTKREMPFVPDFLRHRIASGQGEWLAERRRISIVFLDLSAVLKALPGDESNSAHARASQAILIFQRLVFKYQGFVRQVLEDDKGFVAIALWGLPGMSTTDDVDHAVLCGLETCATLDKEFGQRCPVFAGCTTGQAFLGTVGSAERSEYAAMGNAVNMSARLMGYAMKTRQGDASRFIIDETTKNTCKSNRLSFEVVSDSLMVKGASKPLTVFAPSAQVQLGRKTLTAVDDDSPLVGRDSSLKEIDRFFDHHTPRAHSANVVLALVEGPSGIGKTYLVSHYLHGNHSEMTQPVMVETSFVERLVPYHALRACIKDTLGYCQEHLPASGTDIADLVARLVGADLAPYLSLLDVVIPDCTFEQTPQSKALSSAEKRRDYVFELVASLLLRATEELGREGRKLLLVLENSQWIDLTTLEFLVYLCGTGASSKVHSARGTGPVSTAPDNPHTPLNIVMLHRTVEGSDIEKILGEIVNLGGDTEDVDVSKIALDPLPTDAISELVRRTWQVNNAPSELVSVIASRSHGNPAFVQELCATMLEKGAVRIEGAKSANSTAVLDPAFAVDELVPSSMEALVTSRIDALAPSSQLLVKSVAILGKDGITEDLVEVVRKANDIVLKGSKQDIVDKLVGTDMFVRTGQAMHGCSDSLAFKNPMYAGVIYNLLPSDRRRSTHAAVAREYDRLAGSMSSEAERVELRPLRIHHWMQSCSQESDYDEMQQVRSLLLAAVDDAEKILALSQAVTLLDWVVQVDELVLRPAPLDRLLVFSKRSTWRAVTSSTGSPQSFKDAVTAYELMHDTNLMDQVNNPGFPVTQVATALSTACIMLVNTRPRSFLEPLMEELIQWCIQLGDAAAAVLPGLAIMSLETGDIDFTRRLEDTFPSLIWGSNYEMRSFLSRRVVSSHAHAYVLVSEALDIDIMPKLWDKMVETIRVAESDGWSAYDTADAYNCLATACDLTCQFQEGVEWSRKALDTIKEGSPLLKRWGHATYCRAKWALGEWTAQQALDLMKQVKITENISHMSNVALFELGVESRDVDTLRLLEAWFRKNYKKQQHVWYYCYCEPCVAELTLLEPGRVREGSTLAQDVLHYYTEGLNWGRAHPARQVRLVSLLCRFLTLYIQFREDGIAVDDWQEQVDVACGDIEREVKECNDRFTKARLAYARDRWCPSEYRHLFGKM